jgi:hypothetical protein
MSLNSAIATTAIIRWPGQVKPGTSTYASAFQRWHRRRSRMYCSAAVLRYRYSAIVTALTSV